MVYAWALMPNHAHLLIRTGVEPLSRVMRRILTGYAVSFNRRHKRTGHLFQNRFKSILVEEEPYFLQLIRYIHLNPLRSSLVASLDELDAYPWSGHPVLLGRRECAFQECRYVLARFGAPSKQLAAPTALLSPLQRRKAAAPISWAAAWCEAPEASVGEEKHGPPMREYWGAAILLNR